MATGPLGPVKHRLSRFRLNSRAGSAPAGGLLAIVIAVLVGGVTIGLDGRAPVPGGGRPLFHDVVGMCAVVFGTVWITVIGYHFYPLLLASLPRLRTGESSGADFGSSFDALSIAELPTVDVLLPAYREGTVIDQAIASVRQANYPPDRLRLYILVEPEDTETRTVLAELSETYEFTEVVVPETYPGERNKPRALNYGFEVSDGQVLGVVDAEDMVDPDLFREAVGAIVGDGLDYVQGPLDAVNETDGWKNTLYRGEYGFWYRLLIPAFHRAGYPVPLGGTTNLFHRDVLARVAVRRVSRGLHSRTDAERERLHNLDLEGRSPWDPRNVTEDFELGLFLWLEGNEMGYLSTVTREESPLDLRTWITQRTRWQKGKVYTLAQYLRHPPDGARRKFHCYLLSATPHLGPMNIAAVLLLLGYANAVGLSPSPIEGVLLTAGVLAVVLLVSVQTYSYWRVSERRTATKMVPAAANFLTLPLYWALQWTADVRALKQAYLGQFHWEKTTHHRRVGGPAGERRPVPEADLQPLPEPEPEPKPSGPAKGPTPGEAASSPPTVGHSPAAAGDESVLISSATGERKSRDRREYLIDYVNTLDGSTSLFDLADALAARELDRSSPSPQKRKNIYVSLHHVHLRRLHRDGVAHYDPLSRTVTPVQDTVEGD